jgi:hypothetical protein
MLFNALVNVMNSTISIFLKFCQLHVIFEPSIQFPLFLLQIGDRSSTKETPGQKYQRLQLEMNELAQELEKIKVLELLYHAAV